MKRIRKTIATLLLLVASIIAIHPIEANASTTGWNGNSSKGWWYVDNTGNYVTGWKLVDGNWYNFNEHGWMLHDTWVGSYYVNSAGAWTKSTSSSSTSAGKSANDKLKSSKGGTVGHDEARAQRFAEANQ